jgi:hypothetical protein
MEHDVFARGVLAIVPVADNKESRVGDMNASALSSVLRIYFSKVLPALIVDLVKRLVCFAEV